MFFDSEKLQTNKSKQLLTDYNATLKNQPYNDFTAEKRQTAEYFRIFVS